ncbi:phosphoglycerate mutase [Lophiotrema nucula]|uniref:Phosphoglycerate mutase n=1 Tax=Lophiotrema nucula TaxID=690887 RepID=A0A6A5YG46_9PLEO|nr:phosphoglycerate mutase [Lophiotrema nucula]
MSDLDASTPRVFLARHGETEWTKNGRYTGSTELDLTAHGVKQVADTAALLVGTGRLIDPARLVGIQVSPRKRAQQTFEQLFQAGSATPEVRIDDERVTLTEDITEWDYGDYEGLLVGEIRASRKQRGLDKEREWNIWKDGCEGGESAQQVRERLDRMISELQDIQKPYMHGEKAVDIVVVAHGLILRAFVKRWLKYPLDMPLPMMMSPGAIAVLSYKNQNIDEPGFFVGMALPAKE